VARTFAPGRDAVGPSAAWAGPAAQEETSSNGKKAPTALVAPTAIKLRMQIFTNCKVAVTAS
jgi:hypothetical protein